MTTTVQPKIRDTTWQITQKKLLYVSFYLPVKQPGFLKIIPKIIVEVFRTWILTFHCRQWWYINNYLYDSLVSVNWLRLCYIWYRLPSFIFIFKQAPWSRERWQLLHDWCHAWNLIVSFPDQFLPATHEKYGNETRNFGNFVSWYWYMGQHHRATVTNSHTPVHWIIYANLCSNTIQPLYILCADTHTQHKLHSNLASFCGFKLLTQHT